MSIPKKDAAPTAGSTVEQQETAVLAALDLASPAEATAVPRQLVAQMREAAWLRQCRPRLR